jgi:exopolysaccharide production protein ExoQ
MGTTKAWSASAELEGSPLDRNLYAALLLCGVIALVRRGPDVRRVLRGNVPIILFFLYCGASILWSDYPTVSFKRWIKAVGDLVMVLIVVTDPEPLAALKRLFVRASFLVIPLSILVIKYYPDIGVGYRLAEGRRVITGLTLDKNALGAICMLFGLGFLWRFLSAYRDREDTHRTRHLIVHGTLLAMAMWIFSKANSMTALLCFVLGSGVIVATSIPGLARKRVVVNLLVVTVLASAALPLFLSVGTGVLTTFGRDATLTGRTDIWTEALAAVGNPMLGAGFESFWLSGPLDEGRSFHVNEAHNGYLELYLNLGWIGVVLLAAVIVTGYRNVNGMLRQDPEEGGLLLAFFVVGLTYSMTEAGFRMMSLGWICFLLAALAVPKPSIPQISMANEPSPAPSMATAVPDRGPLGARGLGPLRWRDPSAAGVAPRIRSFPR